MLTLAVETTTPAGSVALFKNRSLVAASCWTRAASHSTHLTEAAQTLLTQNKVSFKNLARVAVTTGPGSFTGIRVGLNFARTLAYALKIPVYSENALRLLAAQVSHASPPIMVVQPAFRDLFYVAIYEIDEGRVQERLAPQALQADTLFSHVTEPMLCLGEGYSLLCKELPTDLSSFFLRNSQYADVPSAELFQFTPGLDERPSELNDWIHTIPLYIRASEAEEKLKSGHFKPVE